MEDTIYLLIFENKFTFNQKLNKNVLQVLGVKFFDSFLFIGMYCPLSPK